MCTALMTPLMESILQVWLQESGFQARVPAEDWSWNYFAIVDYTLYEQMSIIYEVSNGSDKYYTYGYASYNQKEMQVHILFTMKMY